ncbi:glycosyltransferase family 2 protein [Crocinitomix catalasitica]|uniref:glycosyltransferase family 2 protein n=1 Tax=Crocinitomix catalasitica TaxID=184607 RepID=UPI001FDF82EF|nr:glycosyltransferase family 2 protein [Crocinitomix catalasitica]
MAKIKFMKEQALVSIILAAKDTAPFLRDCLDSILNQTYKNWELLAINDHSTDGTKEIIEEYAGLDSRIIALNSDTPKLIPTLQYGYKFAKGDLINRMDSDDKMPHDKLETLVEAWMPYGKGTVIAGGTEHFVDEGEVGDGFLRYEKWLNHVAKHSLHKDEIYKECVIPSHSWIIHKDDLDLIDAFNPLVYPEDYDLCFRMYKHNLNIVGIDKVLHFWRDRDNRISRTWEEYKDNRYFDMKMRYFYEIDRDPTRPLVLWGGGRNGKDMAKIILENEMEFIWVCDSERKIGKDIYGIRMQHFDVVKEIENPQIMIVVSSPDGKKEIQNEIDALGKIPRKDYWFFI